MYKDKIFDSLLIWQYNGQTKTRILAYFKKCIFAKLHASYKHNAQKSCK